MTNTNEDCCVLRPETGASNLEGGKKNKAVSPGLRAASKLTQQTCLQGGKLYVPACTLQTKQSYNDKKNVSLDAALDSWTLSVYQRK